MQATAARPGSEAKIRILQERFEQYEDQELPIHHPEDDCTPEVRQERPCYCGAGEEFHVLQIPPEPTAEQTLAAGLIQQAVQDIRTYRQRRDTYGFEWPELPQYRERAIAASEWLFNAEEWSDRKMTLVECCDAFNAIPEAIREILAVHLEGEDSLCEW